MDHSMHMTFSSVFIKLLTAIKKKNSKLDIHSFTN